MKQPQTIDEIERKTEERLRRFAILVEDIRATQNQKDANFHFKELRRLGFVVNDIKS